MTKKLLLLTLALMLAGSTPAFAHCGACGESDDHGKKGSMMEKKEAMMDEMGLTDEQKAKLKEAKKAKKAKMKEAKEEYKAAMKEILNDDQMKMMKDKKGSKKDKMKEKKGSMKGSGHDH